MSRLIDADKLKAHYAWWEGGTLAKTLDEMKHDFDTIIDLQPTANVVPAEDYRSMEQTVYKLTQALAEAEPNTAIETVNWYHQNADGEMVLGANSNQQAWFKADDVFKALKAEPTKHGRWLIYNILDYAKRPTGRKVGECSVCGQLTPDFRLITEEPNWTYCPNCGARMDEVEE